jgi:hypothetical protein
VNIFEAMKLVQKRLFLNDLSDFILKKFNKAKLSTSPDNLSTTLISIRETTGGF